MPGRPDSVLNPILTAAQQEQKNKDLTAFSSLTPEQLAAQKKPPTWNDVFDAFNAQHKAVYGKEINRTWNTDQDTKSSKLAIDNLYQQGVDAWNKANNGSAKVDTTVLGVNAQPNSYTPDVQYHGLLSQLGDMAKDIAPIVLAAVGGEFLAPALADLFGAEAISGGLAGGGGVTEGLVGAGGAGTSINEMIASGLAPGSVGAYGAAAGALTPEALAAAAGTGLGAAVVPAATQLTPAALESLSGTAGYGTNASAVNAAINAGINPAIVGSGAAGTVADLLAGTSGAAAATPGVTSLNEMVASGLTPGSVGAAGAVSGALTPEALAAAAGTVGAGSTLAQLAATGTKALTPAAIESLAGTAGYGTNAAAVQAAIDAGINPAIVGSGAGLTAADLLAGTTGASITPAAVTPSVNEMVASGLAPGTVGAAGAAKGLLTGDALAAAAGTGVGGTLLSSLTDTLVQKAKDAISTGSPAASSLIDQLKNATGLTGTQLASLLSGGVGAANAANISSAIDTGLNATTAANTASQGVLKDIYNQQLGFQQPYQATGVGGLNQINKLADTGYLTHQFNAQDLAAGLAPNYDFMLQQGQMANQRAANVGGGALSGNTLQGLQNYTQNYAGNAYQNAFNNYQSQRQNIYGNLASMAGIGQTANQGAQAAGTSYGKGTTDLQTALANAQAAASIGKAQALAQGTTGAANSTFLASLLAPPK
jgi:hypothetical protein